MDKQQIKTDIAGNKSDVHAIFLKEDDIPGTKSVKEPSECSVKELKRRLECNGQKKSGKKHELVERVKGLLKLNVKVIQRWTDDIGTK